MTAPSDTGLRTRLLIRGEERATADSFPVYDPAHHGAIIGHAATASATDAEDAMAVAKQLRTGVTFFNNHNATAVDERAPFGGFNSSGIGRELGREGLLEFTETHVTAVPDAG